MLYPVPHLRHTLFSSCPHWSISILGQEKSFRCPPIQWSVPYPTSPFNPSVESTSLSLKFSPSFETLSPLLFAHSFSGSCHPPIKFSLLPSLVVPECKHFTLSSADSTFRSFLFLNKFIPFNFHSYFTAIIFPFIH